MNKKYHLMGWPALCVVAIDQLSKWAVNKSLPLYDSITVIDGFFNMVHVRNRGMAFGLLNRHDINFGVYLLAVASLVAVILMIVWGLKLKPQETGTIMGLSLIIGGALGNLIDRLRFHEVIDFLDFYLGDYHWPSFNIADSAITLGTIWVGFILIFRSKGRIQ